MADPATASAVNFSFYPVPDSTTNPVHKNKLLISSKLRPIHIHGQGVGCEKSDKLEACALDVTGCEFGCSGTNATILLAFVTCLEHPGPEGVCHPQRQKDCAKYVKPLMGALNPASP